VLLINRRAISTTQLVQAPTVENYPSRMGGRDLGQNHLNTLHSEGMMSLFWELCIGDKNID
jgi:hypothetical protein